jgi:polyferredoxin
LSRFFVFIFLLFSPLLPLFAQEEALEDQCHRPPTAEMAEYKEAYVPHEFSWESFHWEVADVVVLAAMLALASVLSVRHHPKCRFTALSVLGLVYFGFVRGGCICPVGATTNFFMGLAAPELIGRLTIILFFLPLVTSFFFGRVFCTSACPLGAIQHLLSRKKGYQIPDRLNRILRKLPIFFLIATAWGALRGGIFLACRLDVYKMLFFTGHAWIQELGDFFHGTLVESHFILVGDIFAWSMLLIVLALGVFIPRPFCRFVCPYGVLLGIFARLGLRRREIDPSSCFACVMCTKTCPVQAISSDPMKRVVKVSDAQCIQCGRCDGTCSSDSFSTPSPFPENTSFPNIARKSNRSSCE